MALPLTPTTELEAVNVMLTSIGEQPVNTLDTPGISVVSIARAILHQTSRQVQERGLRCNTETDFPLPVDEHGNVRVPANTLKVDPTDPTKDYVLRGDRLYDRRNRTYTFTEPVRVDLVLFLPFEQLPQAAREYITIRAARIFQTRVLGSETLHAFTLEDERQAFHSLIAAEVETGDYNVFDHSPTLQRMLRRW